jgi:hypothetical protein
MSLYFEGDYEIQFPIPESGLHSDLAPTLDQLAQMAEIRRFAGSADLGIYFITFESVNNNLWSALYFGRDGSRYWVEAKTNRIVQFEGGSMPTSPAATQKSDAELKELAQGFALVNSLKFQRLSSDLVLSDRPEGSLRVFRWEYSTKTNTGSEPPFIQITMLGDGTVTGYTDTLDFPEP